jgi:hypothetical protein
MFSLKFTRILCLLINNRNAMLVICSAAHTHSAAQDIPCWGTHLSEMWGSTVWQTVTKVSEELAASIFTSITPQTFWTTPETLSCHKPANYIANLHYSENLQVTCFFWIAPVLLLSRGTTYSFYIILISRPRDVDLQAQVYILCPFSNSCTGNILLVYNIYTL